MSNAYENAHGQSISDPDGFWGDASPKTATGSRDGTRCWTTRVSRFTGGSRAGCSTPVTTLSICMWTADVAISRLLFMTAR